MNRDGQDILNVDIDPDFLISLVGKLSLTNIPDITETLQSLENNTDSALFDTELKKGTCSSSAPLEPDISAFYQTKGSCSGSSNSESKDGFLSSIGLLSAPHTTEANHIPLPQDNFVEDASGLWNALASNSKRNKESCRAKEKLIKSKDVPSKRKTNSKNTSDFNNLENGTCDNVESHWQDLPFFSGASFLHKSVNSLQDVFAERGMVYDIQLSDIGGNLKLPFDTDERYRCSTDTFPRDVDIVNCLQPSDKNENLVDESACSPDSGMGTSPCPSAVSPYSPSADLEHSDDSEEYDNRLYEEDLEILLAQLMEIENSLRYAEVPQSNANVPVLKDAKDPEDYIENILNFLKEPIFDDMNSQLSQLEVEDEKPGSPEPLVENIDQSVSTSSSKHIKKPCSKSKKHKLVFEFKYAAKNELCPSSIFSKGKHLSSRNKLLKHIQKDERIQKQVKVIQRLIVSRKLKRTDSGDRQNKKRRIQVTDSCCKSQYEFDEK